MDKVAKMIVSLFNLDGAALLQEMTQLDVKQSAVTQSLLAMKHAMMEKLDAAKTA